MNTHLDSQTLVKSPIPTHEGGHDYPQFRTNEPKDFFIVLTSQRRRIPEWPTEREF